MEAENIWKKLEGILSNSIIVKPAIVNNGVNNELIYLIDGEIYRKWIK